MSTEVKALSVDEMNAILTKFGLSQDDVKRPARKQFKDKIGATLKITDVEKKTNTQGQDQLELSLVAVDGEGRPLTKARAKVWLTSPFSKFANSEYQARAFSDFEAVARSANPELDTLKFQQENGKTVVYDRASGAILAGVAKGNAMFLAQAATRGWIKNVALANPDVLLGKTFRAQYNYYTNSKGEVKHGFQNYHSEARKAITYGSSIEELMDEETHESSATDDTTVEF